jgi:hypothetical protein
MRIEGAASVSLLKIKMRVDRKCPITGQVVESDCFAVWLPKEIIAGVDVGDYLDVLCIPDWTGSKAEKVLKVERWVQGEGCGEVIYCLDEYWEGVLRSRSPCYALVIG